MLFDSCPTIQKIFGVIDMLKLLAGKNLGRATISGFCFLYSIAGQLSDIHQ